MSGDVVRFLHAGDFQLGRPLSGLTEVPEELRERLIDAPRLAAQRVFETAILEEVDFLLLSGNILDPRAADPRGMAFLLEQFELLAEHRIATYWVGGELDRPRHWPEEIALPAGVHVFAEDRVEQCVHRREGLAMANVLGTSGRQFRSTEFRHEPQAPVTVAVAHAQVDPASLEHLPVDYWALGGRPEHQVLATNTTTAHYAGSPQGVHPGETGAHGCVLVRTGDAGRAQAQFVPTDTVRWQQLQVAGSEAMSRDQLQGLLMERLRGLATEAGDRPLLVRCVVGAAGRLGARLRQEGLDKEVLHALRRQLVKASPPVWPVSLEAPFTGEMPDDWREEDTILGDYLRAVEEYRDNRQRLDIHPFLAGSAASRDLQAILAISSDDLRDSVLQQAVEVGADLLRGDHV